MSDKTKSSIQSEIESLIASHFDSIVSECKALLAKRAAIHWSKESMNGVTQNYLDTRHVLSTGNGKRAAGWTQEAIGHGYVFGDTAESIAKRMISLQNNWAKYYALRTPAAEEKAKSQVSSEEMAIVNLHREIAAARLKGDTNAVVSLQKVLQQKLGLDNIQWAK